MKLFFWRSAKIRKEYQKTIKILYNWGYKNTLRKEIVFNKKKQTEMKLYIGVNSDNTAIISQMPLMRFEPSMKNDVPCSWDDTQRPAHWKIDSRKMEIGKHGEAFLAMYINCDRDAILALTGKDMSWEDGILVIE